MAMARPPLGLVRMSGRCVLEMLRCEEVLLRRSPRSWCLVNDGVDAPTVVLGLSGKVDQLIHAHEMRRQRVRLVRRFTGGGTVILDEDSILVSLIVRAADLEARSGAGATDGPGGAEADPPALFPRALMRWSEGFYRGVFAPLSTSGAPFALSDSDYTFGPLKFGGNAQYITRGSFLHHTSFLWRFDRERMACLKHPPKEPEYREGRAHGEFLTTLDAVAHSREAVLAAVEAQVACTFGQVEAWDADAVLEHARDLQQGSPCLVQSRVEPIPDDT